MADERMCVRGTGSEMNASQSETLAATVPGSG
jgi:hypothetical protein